MSRFGKAGWKERCGGEASCETDSALLRSRLVGSVSKPIQ